jgi:outer membrane lipopolysaccharide assembly protein LptE/RlpB
MQKKIFLLVAILFLSSCGYKAIYSKKIITNHEFYISKINFIGDRKINLKIKEKLNNYTINKKNKNFTLNITSTLEKIVLVKDSSGSATDYQKRISLNVEVLINDKSNNSFMIVESFNYKNTPNKFNLKRYEKEINNNLAETAADKLIFKLSNI